MSNPSGQGNHPQQSWNSEKPSPHHPPQQQSWNPDDSNRPSSTRPSSNYPQPPPPSNYPASYPQSRPPASYNQQQPYPQSTYPPSAYPQAPPPQPPSGMAAVHSQVQGSQDPYHRLPPPPAPPAPYPRPDMYAQPGPPPQVVYQAAAPRQRTAIACRYCRRRKIRCSGFESSPDGRCTNCVRFNQECMFTPVSSQAQAFVPAHAAYPHLRNPGQGRGRGYPGDGVVLYGAHGQPLPPQQQSVPETTLPPPQGGYYPPGYGRPPHMDDRIAPPQMPHPMSHDQRQQGGRRGSGAGFEYPEPINLAPVSTGASAAGYPAAPYYHAPGHDRRSSPQSYAYDRASHGSGYPPMPAHGTPPPIAASGASRGGLNVRDILNNPPGETGSGSQNGGRSSTDSDMLNQLNRKV